MWLLLTIKVLFLLENRDKSFDRILGMSGFVPICNLSLKGTSITLILNKTVHSGLGKNEISISSLSANLYIFLYNRV